jgi:regulator of CtrA degradation
MHPRGKLGEDLFAFSATYGVWHSAGVTEEQRAELTPKLVDSLYVEAMVLADEARSYFDAAAREDRLELEPVDRVGFSCESLKVTTRLMHVIAWLLTQRAVAAGELTRSQAGESERRLGPAPESDEALMPRLPAPAVELIRSSEELYERVQRLDEGSFGEVPPGSPARSLLNRLERSL